MSEQGYYTLATWHVKPGQDAAFVAAWDAMGDAFAAVPGAPALEGTLLRRLDAPHTYVSFGAWPEQATIERMRQDTGAAEAMAAARACCVDADPAAYEIVRVKRTAASPTSTG